MPYCLATTGDLSFGLSTNICRISKTSLALILAAPCLPRKSRSSIFCAGVPDMRCSGLIQTGLSQVCLITLPVITSPVAASYISLCAFVLQLPRYDSRGYPSELRQPVHRRQVPCGLVLLRSFDFNVKLIVILYCTGVIR